jgi:hypothetical protein
MWQDEVIAHLESVIRLIEKAPNRGDVATMVNIRCDIQTVKQAILEAWPKPLPYSLSEDAWLRPHGSKTDSPSS